MLITYFLFIVRYISLKDLQQISGLDPHSHANELVQKFSEFSIESFTQQDLEAFLSIQNLQTKVFNSWIEQLPGLKELLSTGKTLVLFKDTFKWSEHQSFGDFQRYVAPFFSIILQNKNQIDFDENGKCVFSYLPLISLDARTDIEQTLFYHLQKKLDLHFERLLQSKNLETFYEEMVFLLGDDVFFILNHLSRNSHGVKVQFTERIISFFSHNYCHAKSANWMLNRLQLLDLNEKQKESLSEIRQKLKAGSIRFAFKEKSKSKFPLRLWLSVVVIALILAGGGVLLTMDFSMPPNLIHEGSALKYFSVKERKEIDSVLRTMNVQPELPDESYGNYSGVSIALRKPYANDLAEAIYRELELEMSLHFQQGFDSSKVFTKAEIAKLAIKKVESLSQTKLGDAVEINNTSDYDFMVLAWDEEEDGNVHCGFIASKTKIQFKLKNGSHCMLVPGLRFAAIPTNQQKNFRYLQAHFQNIDFNFEQYVQNPMQFLYPSGSLNKLLIEGKTGEVIYVNDVKGAFSY